MKIYVVITGQGAYSDRDEWPEIAFSTREAAEAFVRNAQTKDRDERDAFWRQTYKARPMTGDYQDYRIDEIGLDQQIEPVRGEK
jgi:hypothetical protein